MFEREDLEFRKQNESQRAQQNQMLKKLTLNLSAPIESQSVERLPLFSYMQKEYERSKITQVFEREPKMSVYEKMVVDISKKLG